MRRKNPDLMKAIMEYSEQYFREHHKSPSCREIARHVPLGRSAVHNYLVAMNDSGMIEYDGQTVLTPAMRDNMDSIRRVGMIGSVACGLPEAGVLEPVEYMSLPVSITGVGEVYLLRATGDSMIEAGIDSGDMVLVRRQETARDGDIVVAWVEGEGNTLKRFRRDGQAIVLHPENRRMKDIRVSDCRIQGVAIWVFKNLAEKLFSTGKSGRQSG